MNTKLLIIVVIVILAAAGIWWWQAYTPTQPVEAPPDDTSAAISQELGTVDLGNLDAEFQQIDADLNTL